MTKHISSKITTMCNVYLARGKTTGKQVIEKGPTNVWVDILCSLEWPGLKLVQSWFIDRKISQLLDSGERVCQYQTVTLVTLVTWHLTAMKALLRHSRHTLPSQPSAHLIMRRKNYILRPIWSTYLIFVIFFTQAKFLENKIYTEIYTVSCQFFVLNL